MDAHPLIKGLNEKQQQAVLTTTGPVLVIAGAGSGKTRALTHRVTYLIREMGVAAHNILAVTFTNKAAGEMRERITKLLAKSDPSLSAEDASLFASESPSLPTIGTFHSLCVRILRKHIHLLDFENQFTIYDASDQLVLMKHLLEDLQMNEKELNPRAVLAHISSAKSDLLSPSDVERRADSFFEQKVARLYGPYQERLKKNNALDFDDLLTRTLEIFQKFPDVLDQYQEKFRYIHVDEYQDTNRAQYMITQLLAAKYRNLYVIGDHDQSIYSWRGANVQNILDFEKDYPDATVITMEQNYRSTQKILDAAHSVIAKNRQRKDKKLWTDRGDGEPIRLMVAENERHEAELVAQEITKAIKQHESPDYRDFVLLYRINAQSRTLEEVFMRYGIPYKIVGGIRFYERKEVKDIMAYLKVISNPSDTVSLLRIINTPQRQLGPKTLEHIQTLANVKDCTFFEAMKRADEIGGLPDAKRDKIIGFVNLIQRMRKYNQTERASALIKYVVDESGYKKYIDDGTVEAEARLENIAELISVSSKYDKLEPGISLSIFLEEVSLISDLDNIEENDNAVTLMTMHAAKGLEFPWVFICGLEEGLLPHSRSLLSPEDLEEERRLFYVGCTRAMVRLYLLHTKSRMFYGETNNATPSQFLEDIPQDLIETPLKPGGYQRSTRGLSQSEMGMRQIPNEKSVAGYSDGDRVLHKTFGEGIVLNTIGGVVTVAFRNPTVGIKKLAVSIAPLEKI